VTDPALALSADDLAAVSGWAIPRPLRVVQLLSGESPHGPVKRAGLTFSRPVAIVAYVLALAYRAGRGLDPKRMLAGKPAYEAVALLQTRAKAAAESSVSGADWLAALLGQHGLDVGGMTALRSDDAIWLRSELDAAFPRLASGRCPAWRRFIRAQTDGLGDALMAGGILCREGWLYQLDGAERSDGSPAQPIPDDSTPVDPEVPDAL